MKCTSMNQTNMNAQIWLNTNEYVSYRYFETIKDYFTTEMLHTELENGKTAPRKMVVSGCRS